MCAEPRPGLELADAVPGAPRMGLRERKKAELMRRLQRIAIEQFEEHGFDQVTIEHIAAHAQVSPSTVYRYYGTKEALVLRDEFDEQIVAVAPTLLADRDLYAAFDEGLRLLTQSHLDVDGDLSWRRVKVWMETPSVRASAYMIGEEMAHSLTRIVAAAESNDLDEDDAHVVCTSLVFAVFAAIENWYRSDGKGDMFEFARRAVRLVSPSST